MYTTLFKFKEKLIRLIKKPFYLIFFKHYTRALKTSLFVAYRYSDNHIDTLYSRC